VSMQLDIFDDSRDVALRNAVVEALLRDDAAAAGGAAQALRAEFPDDWSLAPGALLVQALGAEDGAAAFDAADGARELRTRLQAEVEPAARRVLGAAGQGWMARRWACAARRAERLPWSAPDANVHPAALWLLAAQWDAAAAAVERIPSWRRIPQPLAWMAQARWQASGLDRAWPLLAELAWLAPRACGELLQSGREPSLVRLCRAFEADFEGEDDWCWFPAWALTEQPLLAPAMETASAGRHDPPEQAFRTLLSLLRLERQGRQADIVEHRRTLRGLHEGLFRCYMRRR
jgi:hypothetical protein